MFLITGAAGKTGRAVLKALLRCGVPVRVLVRRDEQAAELEEIGAAEAVIGDMADIKSLYRAVRGVKAVYHICPNMHPAELEIGRLAITAARESGLEHFVYHSVLHPQIEMMPHHWQKLRVEELLFASGLEFTILQPAPYMQNILAGRDLIVNKSLYRVPYPVETRLSLIDLEDLAEAAAAVLTEPGHRTAVYEIVGTAALTQEEIAGQIGRVIGKDVCAEAISPENWRKDAEKTGLAGYALETLQKMFEYYSRFGLGGNPYVLSCLLGREPRSLAAFTEREFI